MNDQLWAVNAREDVRVQDPNPEPKSPKDNETQPAVSVQQDAENKYIGI
jgi:hypothetical protein